MIIRFYGSPMQALLSRYLGEAFGSILRQQEAMQSEMAKALQAPFAPLTELARQNMELWQSATRAAFTGGAPSSRPDSNASDDRAAGPSGAGERPGGAPHAGSASKKRNKASDKGK
jgi:polyhydroxyalkanoate synthesis regulator protein